MIPVETLYQVQLGWKVSAAAHIRALLLSTITRLPVTLHSIRGEQDDTNEQAHIRAEMTTAGRNNEAIEQVVMRLSIGPSPSVLTASWKRALVPRWHGLELSEKELAGTVSAIHSRLI